ncbi:MAG: hypothetical protein RR416_05565 [Clostridia bacterium]
MRETRKIVMTKSKSLLRETRKIVMTKSKSLLRILQDCWGKE